VKHLQYDKGTGQVTLPLSELATLASAVVHLQEYASPTGHPVDLHAANTALQAVQPVMDDLASLALLPVRR
jgi:hypothetical protein